MPSRRELANAIRALSMDAVQQANSGHPGAPMGMADIAESLWRGFLRHNPANPHWADRDRFVLSNGHGSMLIYALLHLCGYGLATDDLKAFRQLGSKTPGHPEYGITPGVETTTGPLGQGLANAVGMAIAEKILAAHFNRPGHDLVDHRTWVFVGDGCLMEGISHEACSLAGTLGLGKLVAFYDDNGISIDGHVEHWFADDSAQRFAGYGWQVIGPVDGHDGEAVDAAIREALAETARPSLIVCRTVIGYGAPNKQGSHDVHGAPLGAAEIAAARAHLGWPHAPFEVPAEIYAAWDARAAGAGLETAWQAKLEAYRAAFPDLAIEFERRLRGERPAGWAAAADACIEATQARIENLATRVASQKALNAYAPLLPELLGGSADLTPSNNTTWAGSKPVRHADFDGNYLNWGVREFGMSAAMNGIALHGGFIPYGGTFLVFSDYARNALRVAALAGIPSIFVYTHDSIGLGEDGPTHQPIEQLASLRALPNLPVWRPCDAVESAVAWRLAIERRDGPSVLVFSRQNLPHQAREPATVAAIARGGYVLVDCQGTPELMLIATGSEVGLAVAAATELSARGRRVRVVSMPCADVFDAQAPEWREAVLPSACRARLAIEAGATQSWYRYVGLDGRVIGLDRFGESAPAGKLFEHFGFTLANVVTQAETLL